MAAIFLLVFVLVTIPIERILSLNCTMAVYENIMSCDQCIKCGGLWCINPNTDETHCARSREDGGCSTNETLIYPSFPPVIEKNETSPINPFYVEYSIKVRGEKNTEAFSTPIGEIDYTEIHHTGNSIPQVKQKRPSKCHNNKCHRSFGIKVDENFCSDTGGPVQHFNISLKINKVELAKVKFNVACACQCSKNISVNDKYCSGRGNLSCGACACGDRWEGKHCELEKPYDESEYVEQPFTCDIRGDGDCKNLLRPDVECSGNGKCGDCCDCDRTKVGWQYFNQKQYCEDICMTTAEMLKIDANSPSIYFIRYNESLTTQMDSKGRNIWVKCNEMIEEFIWEYYARKNVKGEIAVMMKSSPEAAAIESGGVNVTALVVPLVIVAAVAMAAVAYYVFKGQPAPQPSRANYQGLDGPKTRVETNPVYIEPIKSYKNPTYGQNK